MRGRSSREAFWRRMEQLGRVYGVGGASLIAIAAGIEEFDENIMALSAQTVRTVLALAAALLVYLARRHASGEASAAILAGSGILCLPASPLSADALAVVVLLVEPCSGLSGAAA